MGGAGGDPRRIPSSCPYLLTCPPVSMSTSCNEHFLSTLPPLHLPSVPPRLSWPALTPSVSFSSIEGNLPESRPPSPPGLMIPQPGKEHSIDFAPCLSWNGVCTPCCCWKGWIREVAGEAMDGNVGLTKSLAGSTATRRQTKKPSTHNFS